MSDRPVLVTGAGGFIGSHLTEELLRRGERVRALVRYTSTGRAGWLDGLPAGLRGGLEVVLGDVRDARAVREAARGCRRVFHLAALIGIPYSYRAPDAYVDVNVRGTLNVLEAARDLEVERTVVTSTSEVYGTAQYTPIDERHPLQAQSPYAASKVGADQLALSYQRSFGLPVCLVRPFNTYGPRQSLRAVIPTILAQAVASDEVRLGSLKPVRDLVYVEDTVAGFLAVMDCPALEGKVANLATGRAVSVGELVERVGRLVGRRLRVVTEEERKRPESSEVYHLCGSAALAREACGWEARVPLDEGLARTLAWFRRQADHVPAGAYHV